MGKKEETKKYWVINHSDYAYEISDTVFDCRVKDREGNLISDGVVVLTEEQYKAFEAIPSFKRFIEMGTFEIRDTFPEEAATPASRYAAMEEANAEKDKEIAELKAKLAALEKGAKK